MDNKNTLLKKALALAIILAVGLGGYFVYANMTSNKKVDIYEKILVGDFSGVAGEYINSKGESITLLSDGRTITEGTILEDVPQLQSDGSYTWNETDVEGPGGHGCVLYPVGISVYAGDELLDPENVGVIVTSDTSKIRLFCAQDFMRPEYADSIYHKK